MENKQKDALFYDKLRTFFLGGIFVLMLALLIGAVMVLNSLRSYEKKVGDIVDRVDTLSAQLEEPDTEKLVATTNALTEVLDPERIDRIVTSLDEVSADLKAVSWGELAGNIGEVASNAQTNLTDAQEALAKLKDLDVGTLNKAITDLQKVIEPLSKFSGVFG